MQLLANILQKPQEGLSLVQLVPVLIPPSDTVYECVGVVLMGGCSPLGSVEGQCQLTERRTESWGRVIPPEMCIQPPQSGGAGESSKSTCVVRLR